MFKNQCRFQKCNKIAQNYFNFSDNCVSMGSGKSLLITTRIIVVARQGVNIAPVHCFDVTLAEFEQVMNNDFMQLEAEWLNDINYFCRKSNKFGIVFA